jgi:hypothetical protein
MNRGSAPPKRTRQMTSLEKIAAALEAGIITAKAVCEALGEDAADAADIADILDSTSETSAEFACRKLRLDGYTGDAYTDIQRSRIESAFRCGQISRATYEARIKFL